MPAKQKPSKPNVVECPTCGSDWKESELTQCPTCRGTTCDNCKPPNAKHCINCDPEMNELLEENSEEFDWDDEPDTFGEGLDDA